MHSPPSCALPRFLRALLACLWLLAPLHGRAEDITRIVVPYGPGPGLDAVARILARQLSLIQGHGVIVENRQGAGTVVGTEHVHQAKPDGRTLLINGSALPIGAVKGSFSFDPLTGLKPVIQVSDADSFLLAHAGLPAASLDPLIALGRSRRLNCGAVAGQYEIACLQLQQRLGSEVLTVVYKGPGEATTALMSGEVDLMFASKSMMAPLVPTGKVRVLAAATEDRAEPPYADLPQLRTRWPGFVLSGLVGVYAPRDTPPQVIDTLNQQFNQALAHPDLKQAFRALGVVPVGGSVQQLTRRLAEDHRFFSSSLRKQ